MADGIEQVACYSIAAEGGASQTGSIVNALAAAGVEPLAFALTADSAGKLQLDVAIEDGEAAAKAARDAGLSRNEEKSGFLIQGTNRPGAIADLSMRLADAHIAVTVQAISAGGGRLGALIWVTSADAAKAAELLGSGHDQVDESSEESFPASDPPSWV